MDKRITIRKSSAMGPSTLSHKSINASNGVLKADYGSIECDSSTYFGPFVSQGFLDLYFRVNNSYDSGINPTHSLETGI